MAKAAAPTRFVIPTYARVLCNDWSSIKQFIVEHGAPMKDKVGQNAISNTTIPSSEYMSNALSGPFAPFIELCLSCHAKVARVRLELNLTDNDLFKRETTEDKNPAKIPERILSQSSVAECDNLNKQLTDHIQNLVASWRDHCHHWMEQLSQQLSTEGLTPAEIELQSFFDDEPISDLYNRFIELKLEHPKRKSSQSVLYYYLNLKLILLVQSVLSRLQKPHNMTDIDPLIKTCRPLLDEIQNQAQQLLETQRIELLGLIAALDYQQ